MKANIVEYLKQIKELRDIISHAYIKISELENKIYPNRYKIRHDAWESTNGETMETWYWFNENNSEYSQDFNSEEEVIEDAWKHSKNQK